MFKKGNSLKINTISNILGSGWTALISLTFVPIYLSYLGIESYGLIGVFASVQILMLLFDFGLSPTLNRELARLSALTDTAQEMRNTTRTLEVLNWIIAGFVGLVLSILSPLLANYWVRPERLSVADVSQCFAIMSISFALQYPATFYTGGLAGLQKQLSLNLINVVLGTIKAVGAILVLIFVSNTIQAFLIWQAVIAGLQTLTLALMLWHILPSVDSPSRFRLDLLKKTWRFAVGMVGISLVSLVLLQTDKVILSRMLTLENFGYYALATSICSMVLGQIANSLSNAVYPKFSQLVALGDEAGLRQLYHQSCQFMSIVLLPTAAMLVFFSTEILRLWVRNEIIVTNTHFLLTIIAAGTGIHGLMWLPYQLQLAHGWTKLSFYVNVGAIVFLIPAMLFAVTYYGAIGGAVCWLALCLGYVSIGIPLMHRRLLKGEQVRWYLVDVGLPLLTTVCITVISSELLSAQTSTVVTIIWLALTWAICVLLAAFASPIIREKLLEIIYLRYFMIKEEVK